MLDLDTSSSPPSTLQYWHSLRDMRLTQKSHFQFWFKDRCHLGSQRKVFIRISHRCIHSHQRPDASSMESHHGQLVFFFSCENAKSRACSLVGGRPPTDRVQVAVAAHIRTLSEGRLTRKIGSAPPDLLHFFPVLCISCIGQTDFWKSCHCINLECSKMPGSPAIRFNLFQVVK